MTGVVRRALMGDADEIGRAHYDAHIETYAGVFPEGVIEGFPARARSRMWSQVMAAGSGELWVGEVAGEIVGFAWAGQSRDDPPVRALELGSIYVLAAHHGSGLGQQLLDAALGSRAASLWVLDVNPRAHAFYARNGFSPDGAEKIDNSFGNVRDIRMVR